MTKRIRQKRAIEGVVVERFDDYITATLIDAGGWEYYAEIDLDRFADTDQPHCKPGALFYISEPGPELKLRYMQKVSAPTPKLDL